MSNPIPFQPVRQETATRIYRLCGKKMSYNKYGVSPKSERTLDGIVFDSKLEMNRYAYLKMMQKAGNITNFGCQAKFELQPAFVDCFGKKVSAISYIADFEYMVNGERIVEDTKGIVTPVAKLKIKMFKYKFPNIRFYEIKSANDIGGLQL